jgi:Zn-dependent protease/predicted transcriptional regulator
MKWSWKLFEFAGIGVYMHATFLLLLGWVVIVHWIQGGTVAAVLSGLAFILALFACVILHEFGHALTARRYGIKTRDITLLPIGGVARLERMPDKPVQELWVALAGPAVNVVIAAVLLVWLGITSAFEPLSALSVTSGSFVERLAAVNIFLVLFNMVPAFPMDGGRVLRALLAMQMEYTRATQVAAGIGQGLALLFGFLGLFTNPLLVFIALFVWIGASQETSMVQMKSALAGIPVSRAMLTDYRTLRTDDPLSRAVDLILSGSQQDFPVLDNGHVAGVLTRDALFGALQQQGPDAPVASAMRCELHIVDSFDMLESAFARLQAHQCHTFPVTHHGQLVGLLTMDNVGEFLAVQTAISSARSAVRSTPSINQPGAKDAPAR